MLLILIMGQCQSEDFKFVKQVIVNEYTNQEDMIRDVTRAIKLIEKNHVTDAKFFQWQEEYLIGQYDWIRSILHHSIQKGKYRIALALLKTGRYDEEIKQGYAYDHNNYKYFNYYPSVEYQYNLLNYLGFSLIDHEKCINDINDSYDHSIETDPAKAFRFSVAKNRDLHIADLVGKWLVDFYLKHKPSVLNETSTFHYKNRRWIDHNLRIKSNMFTFTLVFNLPHTRQALLETKSKKFHLSKEELKLSLFQPALQLYHSRNTYHRCGHVWEKKNVLTACAFSNLGVAWRQMMDQKIDLGLLKSFLEVLLNSYFAAKSYSSNKWKKWNNADFACALLSTFHQSFNLREKKKLTQIMWEIAISGFDFQNTDNQAFLLELLTQRHLAQINLVYLKELMPKLIFSQFEDILLIMRKMGVQMKQEIYFKLLKIGCFQIAQELIEENSYWVNNFDDTQRIALHWAIYHQNIKFVTYLLGRNRYSNSNVITIDKDGNTPFLLACQMEDDTIASKIYQIKDNKIRVNHRNNNGNIAFHFLCTKGHTSIIEQMVANKEIPTDKIDMHLNNDLHYATKYLTDPTLLIQIIKLFDKEQMMAQNSANFTPFQILEKRTDLESKENVITFWKKQMG